MPTLPEWQVIAQLTLLLSSADYPNEETFHYQYACFTHAEHDVQPYC